MLGWRTWASCYSGPFEFWLQRWRLVFGKIAGPLDWSSAHLLLGLIVVLFTCLSSDFGLVSLWCCSPGYRGSLSFLYIYHPNFWCWRFYSRIAISYFLLSSGGHKLYRLISLACPSSRNPAPIPMAYLTPLVLAFKSNVE